MKKDSQFLLVGITILFVGFLLGMLVGRSIGREPPVINPAVIETSPPESTSASTETGTTPSDGKININTASVYLLDTLPGIGPVIAQRIVDYREQFGPFRDISELSNVEGIGPSTMYKIIELITVED